MWTEMNLGSNIIANVPGIVLVETGTGREQLMSLEVGDGSQQVLLTIDVYDADKNHVAKLRRNAWVFNDAERFKVTTTPESLRLSEKDSGTVVVEANVLDRHRVQVLQGDLYTPFGDLVEIRPDRVVFRTNTFMGNRFEGRGMGAAIVIGPMGFSLGAGL